MEQFSVVAEIMITVVGILFMIGALFLVCVVIVEVIPERPKKKSRKELEFEVERLNKKLQEENEKYVELIGKRWELENEYNKLKETMMPKPIDGKWEKGKYTIKNQNTKEFRDFCKPVVEWLQKNASPMSKIIIEYGHAELVSGDIGETYDIDD